MLAANKKTFEVDQIVCGRKHKGCQEYLVYWKGFDLSASTWEPIENLLSCADLIEQFQRKVSPIPGANPFILEHLEKTKTVHVNMLLSRKNRSKKSRSKSLGNNNSLVEVNKDKVLVHESPALLETTPVKKTPEKGVKRSKKRISESERLIQDTLLHESKTMKPEKENFTKINNKLDESLKHNGAATPHKKKSLNRAFNGNHLEPQKLVLSVIERGYMKITLNNTDAHNLITIPMLESLRDYLIKAMKSKDVKAILLTGNGSHFCSGIDYSCLVNCNDDNEWKLAVNRLIPSIKSFLDVFLSFTKPIVCAVNGPALEFGLALVCNSDFAYGSAKACFDVVYSKLGLTPVGAITHLLPKLVGSSMAKSMLYMSGRVTVLSACDRGLLLDMYGVNSFNEDMEKKMSQVTANSSSVLESTKRLLKQRDQAHLDTVSKEELKEYEQAILTKEVKQKLKDDWTVVINLYGDC